MARALLKPLWCSFALLQGCVIENWIDDHDDVVIEPIEVEEQFFQTPLPKVDVLWIIDDTGSMAQEQARLFGDFTAFVDELEVLGHIYTDRIDVPPQSWTAGFPGVSDRFCPNNLRDVLRLS